MVQKILKSGWFLGFFLLTEAALALFSLIAIYFSVWSFSWETIYGGRREYILWTLLALIVFIFSFSMIYWIVKSFIHRNIFSDLNLFKKTLLILSFIFSLGVISLAGLYVFLMVRNAPYQPFPLKDPNATYTITKKDDRYIINYETTSERKKEYVCSYQKGEKSCEWWNPEPISAGFIASSPLDLEEYVDIPVIVTGKFIHAEEQCNAGKCTKIGFDNFLGLRIDSISKQGN